jgi:hypothetical protein
MECLWSQAGTFGGAGGGRSSNVSRGSTSWNSAPRVTTEAGDCRLSGRQQSGPVERRCADILAPDGTPREQGRDSYRLAPQHHNLEFLKALGAQTERHNAEQKTSSRNQRDGRTTVRPTYTSPTRNRVNAPHKLVSPAVLERQQVEGHRLASPDDTFRRQSRLGLGVPVVRSNDVTPSLSSRYAHSDGRCLSPIFPAQLAFPDAFKNEVLSRPSTFVRLLCAAQTITRATRSGPSSAATVSCHSCPWDRRRGSRSGPTSRTSV